MTSLYLHLSKPLALLAMLLLVAQPSLAAPCCCRSGHDVGSQTSQTRAGQFCCCCSQAEASCCAGDNNSVGSCCLKTFPNSKSTSKPCKCPCGCSQQKVPPALEPVVGSLPSDDGGVIAVVEVPFLFAIKPACPIILKSDVGLDVISSAQRCVRLCRFRL
ncbi:hypothetical protein Poly41_22750 [Novipirellula artificiosorum]|uniref:Uncharacterized protein n=1 Tax=Novipirellula artificiosorum TaxID=2528016 RepID=A0A5C6DVI3_9BACT|nr:hypothetical protein Poly41_22750 [Novipirellula artificiosorum]